jgi:hypothetical protein
LQNAFRFNFQNLAGSLQGGIQCHSYCAFQPCLFHALMVLDHIARNGAASIYAEAIRNHDA